MKIRDDEKKDIFNEYPAAWITGSTELKRIQEWLYQNYNGYKFAIVFDTTKSEYEELQNTPVYFLDCVFDEMLDYMGIDKVKERL